MCESCNCSTSYPSALSPLGAGQVIEHEHEHIHADGTVHSHMHIHLTPHGPDALHHHSHAQLSKPDSGN